MTALDFATVLDRAPVADTGARFHVVWTILGSASYAHAYPANHVDRRHHLCQGRYLSKLRDPSTNAGRHELPLYSPAQIKVFMDHQRARIPLASANRGPSGGKPAMTRTSKASRPDMRALTIWQPWASLIVYGPKRIENRNRKPWARLVGQVIGIHAARREDAHSESHYAKRYKLSRPLPHGALLGFARIVGTVHASDDEWFVGPVGIKLAVVTAYPAPVPMKGAQGYWSVLNALSDAQREHWAERVAIRCEGGGMSEELGRWWAVYDALKTGAVHE